MKKAVNFLVVALVAGSVAWLYASPYHAMRSLRSAAIDGDEARLSKYVDFPAVRENLKTDVRAAMRERSKSDSDGPLAGLGEVLGGTIVDGAVDMFVSPSGIAAISRGVRPNRRSSDESKSDDYKIKKRRLNSFMVEFEDSEAPALVFSRKGIGWQVTRIDLKGMIDR
jgi:hypothetical protein